MHNIYVSIYLPGLPMYLSMEQYISHLYLLSIPLYNELTFCLFIFCYICTYLSITLSTFLFFFQFLLFLFLFIYLSWYICLSIYYLFFYLSIHLSIYLIIYLFIFLSIYLSIYPLSIDQIYFYIYPMYICTSNLFSLLVCECVCVYNLHIRLTWWLLMRPFYMLVCPSGLDK